MGCGLCASDRKGVTVMIDTCGCRRNAITQGVCYETLDYHIQRRSVWVDLMCEVSPHGINENDTEQVGHDSGGWRKGIKDSLSQKSYYVRIFA